MTWLSYSREGGVNTTQPDSRFSTSTRMAAADRSSPAQPTYP